MTGGRSRGGQTATNERRAGEGAEFRVSAAPAPKRTDGVEWEIVNLSSGAINLCICARLQIDGAGGGRVGDDSL